MKIAFQVLFFSITFASSFAGAQVEFKELFVCSSQEGLFSTTLVVLELPKNQKQIRLYRNIQGHTLTPEVFEAFELPGTRGPVVALGDRAGQRFFRANFLNRDQNNQFKASYTDSLIHSTDHLTCK